jgi:hypothetical protein
MRIQHAWVGVVSGPPRISRNLPKTLWGAINVPSAPSTSLTSQSCGHFSNCKKDVFYKHETENLSKGLSWVFCIVSKSHSWIFAPDPSTSINHLLLPPPLLHSTHLLWSYTTKISARSFKCLTLSESSAVVTKKKCNQVGWSAKIKWTEYHCMKNTRYMTQWVLTPVFSTIYVFKHLTRNIQKGHVHLFNGATHVPKFWTVLFLFSSIKSVVKTVKCPSPLLSSHFST